MVLRRADDISTFGEAWRWSEPSQVDLRIADVPPPRPGDRTEIDCEAFVIESELNRDREPLV